jgi:hypothetical protein
MQVIVTIIVVAEAAVGSDGVMSISHGLGRSRLCLCAYKYYS